MPFLGVAFGLKLFQNAVPITVMPLAKWDRYAWSLVCQIMVDKLSRTNNSLVTLNVISGWLLPDEVQLFSNRTLPPSNFSSVSFQHYHISTSGTVPAYNDNFHNGEKSISGDTDSIPPIGFQGLEIPKKQTEVKIESELCRWQVVGLFVWERGTCPKKVSQKKCPKKSVPKKFPKRVPKSVPKKL